MNVFYNACHLTCAWSSPRPRRQPPSKKSQNSQTTSRWQPRPWRPPALLPFQSSSLRSNNSERKSRNCRRLLEASVASLEAVLTPKAGTPVQLPLTNLLADITRSMARTRGNAPRPATSLNHQTRRPAISGDKCVWP